MRNSSIKTPIAIPIEKKARPISTFSYVITLIIEITPTLALPIVILVEYAKTICDTTIELINSMYLMGFPFKNGEKIIAT